ncbi:bifunctional DNA primase/polymerase [Terrabacter koreensis]
MQPSPDPHGTGPATTTQGAPAAQSGAASLPEVRATALWLAAHDVPVFPLTVAGKTPATAAGFKDATTDPDVIARWWTRRPYNVGLSTGPARLVVLDLDTRNHGQHDPGLSDPGQHDQGGAVPAARASDLPGAWATEPGVMDGADVLAVLAARAGQPVPLETRTVRTPSGGMHLYFLAPHPLPSTCGRLGPMIDTRAMGGYVVAPPSRTTAGGYQTINPAPPAPLPGWLLDALTPAAPVGASRPGPAMRRTAAARGPVTDPYVFAAFENEVDAVLAARPGTRNDALNRAAYALGQFIAAGRLNESMAIDALTIAAEHIGLSPAETARTIASGLAAAAHRPRHQTDRDSTRGPDAGRRA